ncbi:hypothetical protein ACW7BJ_33070 [Azospirillum argentinense]
MITPNSLHSVRRHSHPPVTADCFDDRPSDDTSLIGLSRLLARVAAKAWIEGTSDFGDLPGFRDAKPGASDAEDLSFQDD